MAARLQEDGPGVRARHRGRLLPPAELPGARAAANHLGGERGGGDAAQNPQEGEDHGVLERREHAAHLTHQQLRVKDQGALREAQEDASSQTL